MQLYYIENATTLSGDCQEYFGYGVGCIKDGVKYLSQNTPGAQLVVYGPIPDERLYTVTGEARSGAVAEYTYEEKTVEQARLVLLPLVKNTVQAHLDNVARSLGYDDINSAVSYALDDTNASWQAEGAALMRYRTKVWEAAFEYIGTHDKPMPEEVLSFLPGFSAVQ